MKPSIRTFLLINLLLCVTLITSLAIVGNLFLAHKDIQNQLDANLIHNAYQVQALLSDYPENKRDMQKLQDSFNAFLNPKLLNKAFNSTHNITEFQVWDKNHHLLLHSANSPNELLSSNTEGLVTVWINNQGWRIYTNNNPNNQLTVMVFERSNYRDELENQLTQDSIIIMLFTYPLLAALVWVIVGRGLDSLKRVAAEVKDRKPGNLQSVNRENIPTEIEPLVGELNKLFERLQSAFVRNKRFTDDAAHELKTPLAALSAQVQVAIRAETLEERKQALFKVLAGVNRSTHVVQQLLTLSRMDPEAQINEPEVITLAKQASEIAAMIAPDAIAKNIDLELLNPDSPARILGNMTSINILLRNLIDNAIRYGHSGGFVKIDVNATASHVILKVIDNGPGIPKELHERVFERFFRIMGNPSTGSGLGLGIVLQIIKLHHAKIELLTPAHGSGLEVQVTFTRYQKKV